MENNLMVQNQAISLIDSVDLQTIQVTMQKIATFQAVIQKNLKETHDYGVIAGAGSKPTLLKPGGEKICMMFGLNPEYDFLERTENYKDGFFAYNIKCTLYRNGSAVSQGVGNCNSMEKKYRYINSDTVPDGVDASAVEKITDRYGRTKYKIPNPHIADLVNTILKMAKKRAFIDAVLQVASLSDVFTQDLEDIKEFVTAEQGAAVESMSYEEAKNIKVSFGKYKGKTLGELMHEDTKYLSWLHDKSTDSVIKGAAYIVLSHKADAQSSNQAPVQNTQPDNQVDIPTDMFDEAPF
jgi:hypothetical protein